VEDEQTFNFDTIAKNHKDVVDSYENKWFFDEKGVAKNHELSYNGLVVKQ
jgi:hypothetical protein